MENLALNAETLRALGTGPDMAAQDEQACWYTCQMTEVVSPEP